MRSLASCEDVPRGIKPFTSVTTLAELDEAMEGPNTQQLVFAINVPQGSIRGHALEMVYYQCSKFRKRVDNGALKEQAKHAEMEARKQTFLKALLAASTESMTTKVRGKG